NHYLGDPGYLPKDIERYNRATLADLKRVAEQKLGANQSVVVFGVPGNKVLEDAARTKADEEQESKETSTVANTMPDEPWRASQPQAGSLSHLELPVPSSFKLDNGLTVMLVEQHKLPVVSARVVVLSGSDTNPIDRPGLASFTADLLTEGTNRRSSSQIADDGAEIGAAVRTASSGDLSAVAIRTLKQNVDAALDLLSDVALNPKFDPAEIDRVRNRRQGRLLQLHDQPFQLAFGAFLKTVFGAQHPYGYRELGTPESNRAISREEMVQFWQHGYTPGNSALVLTGDLNQEEARQLAQKYFGNWKGIANKHTPPPVEVNTSRAVFIVDKPGAPQTFVLVGSLGVPRSTPDYVPLEVMNNALGGLFSSRLNLNLREEHGYTYGSFSFFAYRRGPGLFAAGGAIRTDATAPAVQETFKELERIRTAPLTADELKLAKGAFALSLAGLFETSEQTAATAGELFTYDLPLDYYQKLSPQIDAVTAEDVQRVANKYVNPDSSIVIAAGDRAKIEPELKKLSLGPVEARDFEGNPVKEAATSGQQ
ncbi:MAG TPA: pitrilysin family protein, partial [Terriglobales bacterium]